MGKIVDDTSSGLDDHRHSVDWYMHGNRVKIAAVRDSSQLEDVVGAIDSQVLHVLLNHHEAVVADSEDLIDVERVLVYEELSGLRNVGLNEGALLIKHDIIMIWRFINLT